jgi:hypothetical protein
MNSPISVYGLGCRWLTCCRPNLLRTLPDWRRFSLWFSRVFPFFRIRAKRSERECNTTRQNEKYSRNLFLLASAIITLAAMQSSAD